MRALGVSAPLLVGWGLLVLLATAASQSIDNSKPKCCNTKLMDSAGYAMIEANSPLPVGVEVKALLLTMCAPVDVKDTFAILILKKTPGATGRLATYGVQWMMNITTTQDEATGNEEKIVKPLATPYTIGPDEYLAVWAAETFRIPIPFDFDAVNTSFSFYLSDQRLTNANNFTGNVQLKHTDFIRWPRTFMNYIIFCEFLNCSDKDVTIVKLSGPPGKAGPPGERGPPGPPGQNLLIGNDEITDGDGGSFELNCDVPKVEVKVDDAKEKIEVLSNQVTQMQQALNAIYNSNTVTGICPTGMLAGTYGVGSCYIIRKELVQMGVAELNCRVDFDAHLVSIDTEIEERFIRNEVLKLARNDSLLSSSNGPPNDKLDTEHYWTAAVYNKEVKTWIWYNEARLKQPVLQYLNWKSTSPPLPSDDTEVCATLDVNRRSTTSNWNLSNCNKHNFYICEISKKCL